MVEPSDDDQAPFKKIKDLHDLRYAAAAEPDLATLARDYLGDVEQAGRLQNIGRFYADHVAGRIKGTPSRRRSDFDKGSQRASQVSKWLRTADIVLLQEACMAMVAEQMATSASKPESADSLNDNLLQNIRTASSGPFLQTLVDLSAFLEWISRGAVKVARDQRPHRGAPKRADYLHNAFEQLASIWRQTRKDEPTFSMNAGSTLKSRHFGAFVVAVLCFERPKSDIDHVTWSLKDWLSESRKTHP